MKKLISTLLVNFFVLCPVQLLAGSLQVTVTDSNNNPLADAVVYLVSNDVNLLMTPGEMNIEQKDKMFQPFVSVVSTGTRTFFPNRDGIGHHVYSFSPSKTFQLPLSEAINTDSIVFDQPGVVTVGCNIHDWMVAYIYVVSSSYYGKSDDKGLIRINDIPQGMHEIHVWHPGAKEAEISSPVSINNDITDLNFSLSLKPEYFWRPAVQDEEDEY